MEIIDAKDICWLIKETLRLIDRRLVDHGSRVGFILTSMLRCKGGYEDYELAEYALLGMLHDIGAYKVEKAGDMLKFENKDTMPHSIYGALFIKYLTPMVDQAKIIMYSHIDYKQLLSIDYPNKDIANFLNLAGKIDLYNNALGEKFDYRVFHKYENVKYSSEAFSLFDQAQKKYDIFLKLKTMEYKNDMSNVLDALLFSDEEKKKYIEMLMYISGFRDEYNVVNTVTCCCVADGIAVEMGVKDEERMKLYIATLLHDLGMLTIPLTIIEAPRSLTPEERDIMKSHVEITERVLNGRIDDEIKLIAVRHHERADGSGYPKGIENQDMTKLQRILQVADTVTGLITVRPYRKVKEKDAVIAILEDEVNHNKLQRVVIKAFISNYDKIMKTVAKEADATLSTFRKLNTQYDLVQSAMNNRKRSI